jgi:hypothetical protein
MAFFSNQKSQFGLILGGLAIENIGTFYGHYIGLFCGHLVYFVAIWYILWLLGILFPVLMCCTKKNLATLIYAANVGACLLKYCPRTMADVFMHRSFRAEPHGTLNSLDEYWG